MVKLSARLQSGRKALYRLAARESFESYVRHGAVSDAAVALKAAAVDEQKFLDLCAGLSAKALSEGRATSHYTWRTVGDGKVRDGHVALAGQVFSWSSPPEGGQSGTAHIAAAGPSRITAIRPSRTRCFSFLARGRSWPTPLTMSPA